jgi:hypothetical protein
MSLKRLHQLLVGKELLEASSLATLFSAANGSFYVIDPQIEYDVPRFKRNINRASLTNLQGLSGMRSGTLRFGIELTGSSLFANAPQMGLLLQGCGFRQEGLIRMTIGAITGGPFRHGETVTQTGSTATATVVADTYTGQTTLWITNQNGLGNGTAFTPTGVLTGGSSGATATPTGFGTMLTFTTFTLGDLALGNTLTQATSTATGIVTSITATGGGAYKIGVRQTSTASFNTANTISNGGTSTGNTPSAVSTQAQAGYGWWPQSYSLSQLRTNSAGLTNAIADGDLLRSSEGAIFNAFGAHADAAAAQFVYVRRAEGHTSANSTAVTNVTQGNEAFISTGAGPVEFQFQIPTLSMGIAMDGVRQSISFARGTVSMSGTIGEPMILQFEFKGAFFAIADQGNVGGVSFDQAVPPVLLDADMALGHLADTYALEFIPCIRTISLAMGNEVTYNECMSNPAGIDNTLIVSRAPTGSIDPTLMPESVWTYMNDFLANTSYRARLTVGNTLGNQFLFSMPALSTTGAPTGDRNGISTRQIAFELTGGSQGVSALNSENELVIIAPYI